MNKRRTLMEKMVALILIAYAIALLLGETIRAFIFPPDSPKHKLYSGLFIFIKLNLDLSPPLLLQARSAFSQFVLPVRT